MQCSQAQLRMRIFISGWNEIEKGNDGGDAGEGDVDNMNELDAGIFYILYYFRMIHFIWLIWHDSYGMTHLLCDIN